MVRKTITKALTDIYEYYRFKEFPSDGQIDQWFKKIRFIPDEAMPWIVEKITDNEKLPSNLPTEIIKLWYQYKKTHRYSRQAKIFQDCPECHGLGLLWFAKIETMYNPPIEIQYVAICAKCDNSHNHFGKFLYEGGVTESGIIIQPVPRITRQQIEDNGWRFIEGENIRAKKVVKQKAPEWLK